MKFTIHRILLTPNMSCPVGLDWGLTITEPDRASHVRLAIYIRVFVPDIYRLEYFQLSSVSVFAKNAGVLNHDTSVQCLFVFR